MSMFNIAASGITSSMAKIDAISNNIANYNTPGYQRESVTFADMLTRVYSQSGNVIGGTNGRVTPYGLSLGTGSYAPVGMREFTAGTLQATGNPLDMALTGNGFFMVKLPNGNTGYTRAGDFGISRLKNGQFVLATKAGYPVLAASGQTLNLTGVDTKSLTVTPTGVIKGNTITGKPVTIGQLGLADVPQPTFALASYGQDLYQLNPGFKATTNAALGVKATSVLGTVQNGTLEASNVNLTTEMANLITAQNSFSMSSQAINIADKMSGIADSL